MPHIDPTLTWSVSVGIVIGLAAYHLIRLFLSGIFQTLPLESHISIGFENVKNYLGSLSASADEIGSRVDDIANTLSEIELMLKDNTED